MSCAVAELERRFSAWLFDRVHRGVRLTSGGALYREAVVDGLARIGAAGATLAGMASVHVVIACGHAVSTLFVMPPREKLYCAVGAGDTHVHIPTCDDDLLARLGESEAHLVLGFNAGGGADRVVAFRQAVMPLGARAAAGRVGRTGSRPRGAPRRLRYFDYVFLLEDAVAGTGLALGWRRLVERHLELGALVAVRNGFVEVDRPH